MSFIHFFGHYFLKVTKLTDATFQNTTVDLFQFANTSQIINNHDNQIKHDDAILEEEHFSKSLTKQNIFQQPPLTFSLIDKSSNEGQPEVNITLLFLFNKMNIVMMICILYMTIYNFSFFFFFNYMNLRNGIINFIKNFFF